MCVSVDGGRWDGLMVLKVSIGVEDIKVDGPCERLGWGRGVGMGSDMFGS